MAMEIEDRRPMPGIPHIHNTLPVAYYFVFAVLLLLSSEFQISDCLAKPSSIQLVDNGYEGIVVALRDDVQESAELIQEIKVKYSCSLRTVRCMLSADCYCASCTVCVLYKKNRDTYVEIRL